MYSRQSVVVNSVRRPLTSISYQYGYMFIFILFDEDPDYFHEESQWVGLIFANPINERIENGNKPSVLVLSVRNEEP